MNKLKNWFCDSEVEDDTSSEEEGKNGEEEWEAIARKSKNREKKLRQKQRKEKLKADTAQKASRIVGIGPIYTKSVKFFEKELKIFEKAKLAAVGEFLKFYLNYTEEDIDELGIEATKMAKDDLIYIVIREQSEIR